MSNPVMVTPSPVQLLQGARLASPGMGVLPVTATLVVSASAWAQWGLPGGVQQDRHNLAPLHAFQLGAFYPNKQGDFCD